jgi:undecaprenyl-diphosphatase
MDYINILLLGIIQGLTEFLPVSSSGHLILVPKLFNFKDQGLAMDAILHLGTLLAVIIYFRKDLANLIYGLFNPNKSPDYHRLAWHIGWASFPAGIIGLLLGNLIEQELRNISFVAWNLLFWSFVFLAAERHSASQKSVAETITQMTLNQVLFIGFAQAIALLPGTSRSGITICGGLLVNLSPATAARFSFLLGTPIILAAGAHKTLHFLSSPMNSLHLPGLQLGVGLLVSFVVGYFSIKLLLGIVSRLGLMPFIIYRIILATYILIAF